MLKKVAFLRMHFKYVFLTYTMLITSVIFQIFCRYTAYLFGLIYLRSSFPFNSVSTIPTQLNSYC